jgi:hypothetical protein
LTRFTLTRYCSTARWSAFGDTRTGAVELLMPTARA